MRSRMTYEVVSNRAASCRSCRHSLRLRAATRSPSVTVRSGGARCSYNRCARTLGGGRRRPVVTLTARSFRHRRTRAGGLSHHEHRSSSRPPCSALSLLETCDATLRPPKPTAIRGYERVAAILDQSASRSLEHRPETLRGENSARRRARAQSHPSVCLCGTTGPGSHWQPRRARSSRLHARPNYPLRRHQNASPRVSFPVHTI